MMQPKVSVVITAYNSDRYLRAALDSVGRQTYRDFELIVVDDGSDGDGAARICSEFSEDTHLAVQYVRQDNGGPSRARNTGLAYSTGSYVAFLDADDLFKEDKLERQVEELDRLPRDYACVLGCAGKFKDGREVVKVVCPTSLDGWLDIADFIRGSVRLEGTPGYYLFRREALVSIGGYDETLWNNEDFDLLLRLAQKYRLKTHREVVFYQRLRPDSLSKSEPISGLVNSLRFANKIWINYPEISLEAVRRRRQRAFFSAAMQCLRRRELRRYLWLVNKGLSEGPRPISLRGWLAYVSARPLRWLAKEPEGWDGRENTP